MTRTAVSGAAAPTRPGRTRIPAALLGVALAVALCAVVVLHLGLGAAGVGVGDIAAILTGNAGPGVSSVLLGSRLPRTLAGLVAGIALGLAGTLIQGSTRNPLAAPDTLGINAGAYFAVVLVAYTGLDVGLLGSGGVAFIGGLGAMLLVYLLIARGALTPGRTLLAGATVMLAGMAGAEFLQILDQNATRGLFFWGNGTLLQTGIERPVVLGVVTGVCALLTPLFARPLDLLSLGDETAEAMGVRVGRVRPAALLLAVLLSASAVTVAGPIGFVGLIAPTIVRVLGVRRTAAGLPTAALLGAVLILGADAAAQLAFPPSLGYGELPVGVITALLGGPVFVLLARRITTGDADVGAAVNVAGAVSRSRYLLIACAGTLALLAVVVIGTGVGDVRLGWSQVLASLLGSSGELADAVVTYRMPRIVVAAVAGACLAVAGAAIQSVVRNPLAEPSLIGLTNGAALGAVLIIVAIPSAPASLLPLFAALGGMLTLAGVVALARDRRGLDPTRVVLVGLGCAAIASALVNTIVVSSEMDISSALTWLAGSTYAKDFGTLSWLVLPAGAAVLLAVAARPIDLLALGDDLPRALGLALGRTRLLVLAAAALLAAGTAAAVGTVGFVGLVAPHLARRLVGGGARRLIPTTALLGAILVVAADALGRCLLAPVDIPVGVVTALLGAPYLVWLLRRT